MFQGNPKIHYLKKEHGEKYLKKRKTGRVGKLKKLNGKKEKNLKEKVEGKQKREKNEIMKPSNFKVFQVLLQWSC